MCAVLLQQLSDGGQILKICLLSVELLVILEGLLRIQSQHFNFCLSLNDIKKRIYPRAYTGARQDRNVSWFNSKKHQIPHAGCDAVVGEIINAHELPSRLLTGIFLFLFSVHVSSLHS